MTKRWTLLAALALSTFVYATGVVQEPVMARAHSHNDYEHARPLLDALDNKFGSVEADIFLVEGELLVAHNRKDCTPARTLEALYLAPLAARVKENGGQVYPGGAGLILLIDIKDDASAVYPVLRKQLEKYAAIFTRFTNEETKPGAVTAILSGNRPIDLVKAETERLCGIDGRLPDLAAGVSPTLMPMISDSWPVAFKWLGKEPMPEEEAQRLKDVVAKAHAGGHKLRFWGLPNRPETVWPVLFGAGVDLLNADDLPKLRAFLLARGN
jgi:hypothetical protein